MCPSDKLQEASLASAENVGKYWTQREIDTLFQLFDKGFSLSQIAEGLGRTYYGVTKMHELGSKEATLLVNRDRRSSSSSKRVLKGEEAKSFWGPDEW
jgi:GcrA cell cycle regulator.